MFCKRSVKNQTFFLLKIAEIQAQVSKALIFWKKSASADFFGERERKRWF
jgi:hypothetical protein